MNKQPPSQQHKYSLPEMMRFLSHCGQVNLHENVWVLSGCDGAVVQSFDNCNYDSICFVAQDVQICTNANAKQQE